MNAHQGLEEKLVGKFLGVVTFGAHRQRPVECAANFRLIPWLHPLEHRSYVLLFQRKSCRLNDRPVHAIAMGLSHAWCEEESGRQESGSRQ